MWSLFVFVLLLLASFPPPAQAQDDFGTIVFRLYVCPYGYADQFYPETCTLAGAMPTVRLDGANEPTAQAEQFAQTPITFAVPPGKYRIESGIPGEFTIQRPLVCNTVDGYQELPVHVDSGTVAECHQLIFGDSGRASNPPDELDLTLTIRARSCALPIPRSAFHDACFDNVVPDALFYISADRFDAEVATGDDGNASVDVPDFALEIDPTGELHGARVWRFCSSADHPGVPLLYPLNLLYHSSPVTCDVYFLPDTYDLAPDLPDVETGLIEVHYRLCPPRFLDTTYYATCHDTAIPDTAIKLASETGDATAVGYSDSTGNVSFRVPPGAWTIPPDILGKPEDTYAIFCTDANDPGATLIEPLNLAPADHVICDLYLIPTAPNSGAQEITFVATSCADGVCRPANRLQIWISSTRGSFPAVLDEYGFASMPLFEDSSDGMVTVTPFVFEGGVLAQFTCVSDDVNVTIEQIESASQYQQYELVTRGHGDITCSLRIER